MVVLAAVDACVVLWGRRDRIIPVAHAYLFQQYLPVNTTIVYDDLGHVPMEEDGRRTAADMLAWLQQYGLVAARPTPPL